MMTFLNRYLKGEYVQVWSELLEYGESVRQEPILSDALAVSQETMARAKTNIERLIPRLTEIGFQFFAPEMVYGLPKQRDLNYLHELEEQVGLIPLSMQICYEKIGFVLLMGTHPEWKNYFTKDFLIDPLVILPIESGLEEFQQWQWRQETFGDKVTGGFQFPLSPDIYHKSNISGGDPYSIGLPNAAIDAPLIGERHNTTFVDYLRICFKWGGFPGFETCETYPREAISYLTEGLLPL
ncbi:MAG: hypothetical protein D9V45_05720 [Chloroflexi bacterium]|nr:MAG: hypothetical protein D9V45_05720 [Chloroflexota bacterium]